MITNLGTLMLFKYLDFGIQNLNSLLAFAGVGHPVPLVRLILPVGISFYTFQSMSYTIDIYRGELRPTRNILHFFASLALFPHLVAGPIIRARDLLPQLRNAAPPSEDQRWQGTMLLVFGYFKKVVIADNLAPAVNAAFDSASITPSAAYWWIIMTMFAFQIYCDFSGYTDIARGLAKWMGYEFPLNFNHPYISASFREFWTRWHISLSSWFRDYVYIPLGGSRNGTLDAHRNMWITMLLSAVWHGAAWTFVFWGIVHATCLSLERIFKWPEKLSRRPAGRHLAVAVVFVLVLVSWVFFRSQSFSQALAVLSTMFNPFGLNLAIARNLIHWRDLLLLTVIILRHLYFHFRLDQYRWQMPVALWGVQPVTIAVLITLCVFFRGPGSAFIYFQF